MELLFEQREVSHIKFHRFYYLTFISLLVSSISINDISMMFALPLFFLCFQCGYEELIGYFVGLVLSCFIFSTSFDTLYVSLGLFLIFELFIKLKHIRLVYLPLFICVIVAVYYYIKVDIYTTLLLTLLTYSNIKIFSLLPPLVIHGNQLLTHQRIRALNIAVLIMISSLLPYSSLISFILMRIYILVTIYYVGIDDCLPSVFYVSLIILFTSLHYQSDVLALILPLFIFYMIEAHNKFIIASLYLCSHLILPFFIDFSYEYHGLMIIASIIIFMLLPINIKRKQISTSFQETTLQNQLMKQVESFTQLFHSMTSLFNETAVDSHSYEYVGYIYEDLCKNCSSQDTCYNQRYGPQRLIKLMNKGLKQKLNQQDIQFINNYCLEPKEYIEKVNAYKKDFEKIQRIRIEYSSMKKELYKQFSLLSNVFTNFSNKLEIGQIEEKHIIEHLKGYHFDIEYLKKYYESQTTYYIEIGMYNTDKKEVINELIPILESYLNESLELSTIKEPMHQLGYTYVLLKHCSRYKIEYGVSQFSKDPLACGDSYSLFHMLSKQYFALSDGMGQGLKANEDSTLTLKVLKELVVNGVSLNSAIQSVNALLKIKNRNDMFTTLDMMEIDLTNANATFIKYGCCSTYILRDDELIEIETKSLPIGIIPSIELTMEHTKLVENDLIFMITDGFHSFSKLIEESKLLIEDDHPQQIATFIMNRALEKEVSDDLSIIVLRVIKQR
jgi:stage II sporulation protein E